MSRLRVLIVDDEPLARGRIRSLLAGREDVEIAGECARGEEAVRALLAGELDVVFLDIRMPDMDGFEVLEAVGPGEAPVVVFVTAHGDHALRAFDVHAVDYLLKPFDDERFEEALARARHFVERDEGERLREQLRGLLEEARPVRPPAAEHLVVRSGGTTTLLAPAEIRWIEAEGSYVRLHTPERSYLLRESMGRIEAALVPHGFQRVHRSHIVSLGEVRELRNDARGHFVVLRDGTRLRVSERHWGKLRESLGM